MSKHESKTINNRELIEVDSNPNVFSLDVALNIYSFLPVSEVLRVLSCVSKLFNEHCQNFRSSLAPELLTQHLTTNLSQMRLQLRLADEEHEENCRAADKVCFRYNFVGLGAVLTPIGIQLVAPKGSPWHETLMGVYSTVVFIALGVVAFRCISRYCYNQQSHRLEKQIRTIKNLNKLSVLVEIKNRGNTNNNHEESKKRDLGAELPYVCDEGKLNTPSCQLHLKSS